MARAVYIPLWNICCIWPANKFGWPAKASLANSCCTFYRTTSKGFAPLDGIGWARLQIDFRIRERRMQPIDSLLDVCPGHGAMLRPSLCWLGKQNWATYAPSTEKPGS